MNMEESPMEDDGLSIGMKIHAGNKNRERLADLHDRWMEKMEESSMEHNRWCWDQMITWSPSYPALYADWTEDTYLRALRTHDTYLKRDDPALACFREALKLTGGERIAKP